MARASAASWSTFSWSASVGDAGEALGERIRGPIPKNKRNMTTIMGEWRALYGAVPPESSLLLRKYRQMYGVPAPGRRLLRSGRTA